MDPPLLPDPSGSYRRSHAPLSIRRPAHIWIPPPGPSISDSLQGRIIDNVVAGCSVEALLIGDVGAGLIVEGNRIVDNNGVLGTARDQES